MGPSWFISPIPWDALRRTQKPVSAMNAPMPSEGYFSGLREAFEKLEGVDALLTDPMVTTVRLVTNPEKMVVRETQRAFTYFSLCKM